MPIVSKFNFVRYDHMKKKKLVLYVPGCHYDGPPNSKVFDFKLIFILWVQDLFRSKFAYFQASGLIL